jgi:hypothetical protein
MAGRQGESAGVGMTTAPAGWAARRRRKRLNSGASSAREGLQPSKGRRLRPLDLTCEMSHEAMPISLFHKQKKSWKKNKTKRQFFFFL